MSLPLLLLCARQRILKILEITALMKFELLYVLSADNTSTRHGHSSDKKQPQRDKSHVAPIYARQSTGKQI